jgi:hypothetical protein
MYYKTNEPHIMSLFPSVLIMSSSLTHEHARRDAARKYQEQKTEI